MILRDQDIDGALCARARQRALIEGRGPRIDEFLLNPYRFGGGGGGGGAHRYWRLNSFAVSGAELSLTAIQLFAGSDMKGAAAMPQTVSATSSPVAGAVGSLTDGNLGSRAAWSQATAQDAGFSINWDLGTAKIIAGFRQGGFDTSGRQISGATLQYSDDNSSWTTQASVSGLTYPGNNTISAFIDMTGSGATAHRYWRLNGITVSASFLEISELVLIEGMGSTLTAQSAPSSGVLYSFVDASISSDASWSKATAENSAFFVKFDFGAATPSITGVKLGGGATSDLYPSTLRLQYSDDDSNWTTKGVASGLTFPGSAVLSSLITPT